LISLFEAEILFLKVLLNFQEKKCLVIIFVHMSCAVHWITLFVVPLERVENLSLFSFSEVLILLFEAEILFFKVLVT
jgi:hypothetical protein